MTKILTEEELNDVEEVMEFAKLSLNIGADVELTPTFTDNILNIIASHHSLLSANAELSFKNQKLTESIKKVDDHLQGVMHPKRLVMLDCLWMHKTLSQALEELKHE